MKKYNLYINNELISEIESLEMDVKDGEYTITPVSVFKSWTEYHVVCNNVFNNNGDKLKILISIPNSHTRDMIIDEIDEFVSSKK